MGVRFRRKGFATYYFRAAPHSPAFMQEYRVCLGGVAATRIDPGAETVAPGSFNDLIARYYRTPGWLGLGDQTRTINRGFIERGRAAHGHRLVRELTVDKAELLLSKMAETPTAANLMRKTLRRLVRYSVKTGMRRDNPFDATRPFKIKSTGYHTWTEDEVARFEVRHPIGTKPRLAMAYCSRLASAVPTPVAWGVSTLRAARLSSSR